MKKPSPQGRKELGAFLLARRGRLQPGELGLPAGPRRTPGLRREEVALLAGVSVSWYTWLEQGRDISVSAEALERLSSVLRLDRAEARHVFALSSRPPPPFATDGKPSDSLTDLVQAIDPVPAYVRNRRLDILVWNAAVTDLFVDYSRLEPHERNTLRLMFLYPPYRTLMRDWPQQARGTMRVFYAARAKAADKAPFDKLAEEIAAASDEFTKRLLHPRRGLLDLTFVALTPEGEPDLSLVTYIARPGTCDRES